VGGDKAAITGDDISRGGQAAQEEEIPERGKSVAVIIAGARRPAHTHTHSVYYVYVHDATPLHRVTQFPPETIAAAEEVKTHEKTPRVCEAGGGKYELCTALAIAVRCCRRCVPRQRSMTLSPIYKMCLKRNHTPCMHACYPTDLNVLIGNPTSSSASRCLARTRFSGFQRFVSEAPISSPSTRPGRKKEKSRIQLSGSCCGRAGCRLGASESELRTAPAALLTLAGPR